jgi:hypothetical protein
MGRGGREQGAMRKEKRVFSCKKASKMRFFRCFYIQTMMKIRRFIHLQEF